MEFSEKEYEKIFEQEYDQQKGKYENLINEKLVISLVGNVNSGKSSTINALTGRNLAEVRAVPGWTTKVTKYEFADNIIIADTPGLQDVNKEVSMKAEQFVEKDTDIILFFLNAAVGITNPEKEAIISFKKLNKPILIILNKIDVWYDAVTGSFDDQALNENLSRIFDETGLKAIPISSKRGYGLHQLNLAIFGVLEEKGKKLLFLKISKFKEKQIKVWINGATLAAGAIGAIPVPGSDIIPLTSLQVGLALKIAYIYDCRISRNDAMQLVSSTITGTVGRNIYRWGISAMKGLGWLGGPLGEAPVIAVAAIVAASTTYAFGCAANMYYKSGMTINLGEIGDMFEQYYKDYKNKHSNDLLGRG